MKRRHLFLLTIFQIIGVLFFLGLLLEWSVFSKVAIVPWAILVPFVAIGMIQFLVASFQKSRDAQSLQRDPASEHRFYRSFRISLGIYFCMVQIGFIGFLTSFLYLLHSLSVLQLSFYYFVAISIPFILAAVFYLIGWKNISKNLPEGSTLKPPRLKNQFIILFGTSLYSLVTIIVSVFLVWFVRFKKQEVGKEIQNQAFISSQNLKRVLDKMENETALLSLTYSSLLSGRTSFDRSASRSLLRDYLLDSAYWEGVWVLFEPNAFDGKDAFFRNAPEPMQDSSGRHMIYYTIDRTQTKPILSENTLVNYLDPEEGVYYQIPLHSRKNTLLEPYFYTNEKGERNVYVSQGAPIFRGKVPIGVVGIDINLRQLKTEIRNLFPKDHEFFLVSQTGKIAITSRKEDSLEGTNLFQIQEPSWKPLQDLLLSESNTPQAFPSPFNRENLYYWVNLQIPIGQNLDGIHHWNALVGLPLPTFYKSLEQSYLFSILVMGSALILSILLSVQLTRPIGRGLNQFLEFFQRGTKGDIRTIQSGVLQSFDSYEFREIFSEFKTFLNRLREIVQTTKDASSKMSQSIKAISSTTSDFVSQAQNQASSVEEATAALEENSASLEHIHENTESQVRLADGTNRLMEALQASIESIYSRSKEALTIIEKVNLEAANGSKLMQDTVARMTEIRTSTEKISETIDIIQGISDQVNLLALNAAIEAARAGEHGRGFAVVAQEIGKLAEGTAHNSQEITKLVESGLQEVESGQKFVEETSRAFQSILESIANFQTMIQQITTSTNESRKTSSEVVESSRKTKEMAESISLATSELKTSNQELLKSVETINSGTQIVATRANDISSNIQKVLEETQKLETMLEFFRI